MPLLYFWRGDNYRRDLDFGTGFHLNHSSSKLHSIESGDSLWAFTRTPRGRYVLAAELVVRAKTQNSSSYRYGRYRVWGDLRRSRYFATADQPSIEGVIRKLSIRANSVPLGRGFQGHAGLRHLMLEDHRVLVEVSRLLELEPRARLVPEERLEALALSGDADAVASLLVAEPSGLAEERRRYLRTEAVRRCRQNSLALRDLYDGRCQLCSWAPRVAYSTDLCEGHHLVWLARGGEDDIRNMALLCPNHHRAVHARDSVFDFGQLEFLIDERREPLLLNSHLVF